MITMSAKQLREALEFANPDGPEDEDQQETELTFFVRHTDEISNDSETLDAGLYCYLTEYPEEGCYGPLGDDARQTSTSAHQGRRPPCAIS